jgi:hypothetical protein
MPPINDWVNVCGGTVRAARHSEHISSSKKFQSTKIQTFASRSNVLTQTLETHFQIKFQAK